MKLRIFLTCALISAPALVAAQQADPFGYQFDDYLCHDIPQGDWIKPHFTLDMADQFGSTESQALKAVFVCNPVKKEVIVDGKVVNSDGVRNEKLHFMCYVFDPGRTDAENMGIKVENEFETARYKTGGPKMICVPSLKERL